jgi:hypothetical protein
MSQFRVKKIDTGIVDEWVPRLNEDGIQIGDDIDARDPNELSEAIMDTQEVLLKVSTLASNAILDPSSGIAERLTILEGVAGQATLQDVYANGNVISVTGGRPLVLGASEEIKIDDSGNLSFNPATMRVRGSGVSFLELTNESVFSTLGSFLIGAISPGNDLTVMSAGEMYMEDVYLNVPITLSQAGDSSLDTTSQSLVGAINELKASAFSVSFQSVYDQSNPPRILTNLGNGPVHFEDPNPASIADAFKVTGNSTFTKKIVVGGKVSIGSNTTIEDGPGISSVNKIKTTVEVETPFVNANINDLTLQDKRLSIKLTETGDSSIDTNSGSIIGAINELKANIDTVGASATLFDVEHSSVTGFHEIITTQADIGQNALERILVKDQTGTNQFSVTGEGDVVTQGLLASGLNVVALLGQLANHLSDDGTAHSAVNSHFIASNPHNVVKTISGLSGSVNVSSPDGSVTVGSVGNTITLQTVDLSDLQSTYDAATLKKFELDPTGLQFIDAASTNLLLMVRELDIMFQRNINLEFAGAMIEAVSDLTVHPQDKLTLSSELEDVEIFTTDAVNKTVSIQSIPFDEAAVKTLPTLGGSSILGNLKILDSDKALTLTHLILSTISEGQALTQGTQGYLWYPISNIHPGNEFESNINFFFSNLSNIMIAGEDVLGGNAGKFYKDGTMTVNLGAGPEAWEEGIDIFLGETGSSDWEIVDVTNFADLDTVTVEPGVLDKIITAVTGVPDAVNGEFKIESTANANLDADKTRSNILGVLNDILFMENNGGANNFYSRATIDGESPHASFVCTAPILAGDIVQINPNGAMTGASVTLEAVAETTVPGYLQFQLGNSLSELAFNLANTINRTTFFGDLAGTLEGHYCKAINQGGTVHLEWYKPGLSGNEVALITSTPNITVNAFLGGNCKLKIYRQDAETFSIPMVSSNVSAMTVTDIEPCESAAQVINESRAMSSMRRVENETKVRIGSVEQVAGNVVRFKI